MGDEPAQQHWYDEAFGPVLAADSALICLALCDNVRRDRGADVTEELWWRDEDAEYIRHRSSRYPGATDLEPAWTLEAAADPRRIVLDPDPKSRTGAVRIIGNSVRPGSSSRLSRPGELALGSPRGRAAVRICGTTRGRDESERDA